MENSKREKKIIYVNKKVVLGLFTLFAVFAVQSYPLVKTALATGVSAPDNVVVTLNVTEGITISDGAAVTMAPNIGISSNTSIGASSWLVKTNAVAGYTLAVKADTNPALKSGSNSFANYTEASAGVPETWLVASGDKEFGYSAFGTDTATGTWGAGADCGTGGVIPAAGAQKYVGMLTTDKTIATRATVTPTAGITTNICFAAEQKDVYAPSGAYTATITATALTL